MRNRPSLFLTALSLSLALALGACGGTPSSTGTAPSNGFPKFVRMVNTEDWFHVGVDIAYTTADPPRTTAQLFDKNVMGGTWSDIPMTVHTGVYYSEPGGLNGTMITYPTVAILLPGKLYQDTLYRVGAVGLKTFEFTTLTTCEYAHAQTKGSGHWTGNIMADFGDGKGYGGDYTLAYVACKARPGGEAYAELTLTDSRTGMLARTVQLYHSLVETAQRWRVYDAANPMQTIDLMWRL